MNLTYVANTTKTVSFVEGYPGSEVIPPPALRMACHVRQERGLQLAGHALGKETMLAQSHLESSPRSRASIKETASPDLMAACHRLAPDSKAHHG